ncbi:hypothetical protein DAD186_00900 [Dermabacter vaginalis]|uniref:Uncharacterized protein n=1 Tax=Dermabacter vaginalis TaxID=1630135 RepID=A0A1B0ZFC4_9MICO|nr:hypothetical protein [Dermabacter vaginalis]ANP26649.1 hypothetical protein DAD186_00900 [Dermabacter vaginalis]
MVSTSDLPELDDPATVEELGDCFLSIGERTKTVVADSSAAWTGVIRGYYSPEDWKVHSSFQTPKAIAENLATKTSEFKDNLVEYAGQLRDFETRKEELEREIDDANDELDAAEAMEDEIEESDPDSPSGTRMVPNPEKPPAVLAAQIRIENVEREVAAFKREVNRADRALARKFATGTFGLHTLSQMVSDFESLGALRGAVGALAGTLKLVLGTVKISTKTVWDHKEDIANFFLHPVDSGKKVRSLFTKENAEPALQWASETVFDLEHDITPSFVSHGLAWMGGGVVTIAHQPATEAGSLSPVLFTSGGSLGVKVTGDVAKGGFKVLADKSEDKIKKDLKKKVTGDPAQEAFNNGVTGSLGEAYDSEIGPEDLPDLEPMAPAPEGPEPPHEDSAPTGALPTPPAPPSHSNGGSEPAPEPTPEPAPEPTPEPAPEPAPAPVVDAPAPAPVVNTPAPAPVVNAPTPAPAPIVEDPAPAPVADNPAPAPVVNAPAPAPAPVVNAPTPAPAPIVEDPAPAPVADAPAPVPVAEPPAPVLEDPAPAPTLAPAPPTPSGDGLSHKFFDFKNQVIDDLSSASGIDADSIQEAFDNGGNVSAAQADQMLYQATEAHPELASILRAEGLNGNYSAADLDQLLTNTGN